MNDEFEDISYAGYMKHNGGFQFRKVSELEYQFRTTIMDFHLNSARITHGGYVASLLDSGMGTAAHRSLGGEIKAATISLDVKYISPSRKGDILVGKATILQKTRSLVFVHGEIRCEDRLISTAEGIWKVL